MAAASANVGCFGVAENAVARASAASQEIWAEFTISRE
jgi:hypothetical protein